MLTDLLPGESIATVRTETTFPYCWALACAGTAAKSAIRNGNNAIFFMRALKHADHLIVRRLRTIATRSIATFTP